MASRIIQAAKVVTTSGPVKTEGSSRRIRVILNGQYIFDTISTRLAWEHPYFPQYYFPSSALQHVKLSKPLNPSDEHSAFTIHDLLTGSHTAAKGAIAQIHAGELKGFARLDMPQMDAFFEEDEPLETISHPLDPYKRVDTRRSSRQIRVEVDGVEIANATWAVHLYETSLPVRYYLPRTSINWALVQESSTKSYCPYKGWSRYWDVVLEGGKGGKDLIWGYETTPVAVSDIQGTVCFYNEKVDIWIDGVKEERPKSKFA